MMKQPVNAKELLQLLRAAICSGRITGKLPSISELTATYRCSHNTVKKVLDQLKMQSLVYGLQGKGVFVNTIPGSQHVKASVILFATFSMLYSNAFYLRMLNLLKQQLSSNGITLDLTTSVDGVNLRKYHLAVILETVTSDGMPKIISQIPAERIIVLNHRLPGSCSISNDNVKGGFMAMEHIYNAGHRKIGVITRDLELPYNFFHDRDGGVADFERSHPDCRVVRVALDPQISFRENDKIDKFMQDVLEQNPEITAIFCFTDMIALALSNSLQRLGVAVPEKISMLGFDNQTFAALLSPPLTTVEENAGEVANELVRQIRKSINGEDISHANIMVSPLMVTRESVAELPVGNRTV